MQRRIRDCEVNANEVQQELETKKRQWLEPLQKHIDSINGKFSHYFKQLSCVGEISLDIPENSVIFKIINKFIIYIYTIGNISFFNC